MTEKYKVSFSPAAKEDLKGIYRYIALDLVEPAIAEKQINRIRESIKKLDHFPKKHQTVNWEPWSSMEMRYIPVDNYIVYYLVNEENKMVTIIRIFYGGRDIKNVIK